MWRLHYSWDRSAEAHSWELIERELERLRTSFEQAKAAGYQKYIMFLHYPPINILERESGFTEMAEEYGAEHVVYAHSHGEMRFHDSVRRLCDRIRRVGAVPVLYASWAFCPGCRNLEKLGWDAAAMHREMQEAFMRAESETHALVANVGQEFRNRHFADELYSSDGLHPSKEGSALAAQIIADAILKNEKSAE